MAKTRVDFYYDIISPWSYIALELLKRYEQPWDLQIDFKPVALGYIFMAAGNRAPLTVPNKGMNMAQEFRMFTEMYKLPVSDKAWTFSRDARDKPPNSMPLMRFVRIVQQDKPDALASITTTLFQQVFAKGVTSILSADESDLLAALKGGPLSDSEITEILSKSKDAAIKEQLKKEGAAVVNEDRAFGVPWLAIAQQDGKKRSFMGSDRFELIAHWLDKPYQVAHTQHQARL